jgi:hypothetical protein
MQKRYVCGEGGRYTGQPKKFHLGLYGPACLNYVRQEFYTRYCLCSIEMFIAATMHRTVFSYRDYKSIDKKNALFGKSRTPDSP